MQVRRIMDRVEISFIKHFANSNRKKGLKALKPKTKKQKHGVSASLGTKFSFFLSTVLAMYFFKTFFSLNFFELRFLCWFHGCSHTCADIDYTKPSNYREGGQQAVHGNNVSPLQVGHRCTTNR